MSYSTGTIDYSNYNIIHYNYFIVIYKKIHRKIIVARKREALEENSRSRSFLGQCAVLFCCKAAWGRTWMYERYAAINAGA